MTATGISGAGPGGVLRMTRVQDRPARVLELSDAGEPSGSWTGLARSDDGLTAGADVNTTTPASAAGLRPARRPGLGRPAAWPPGTPSCSRPPLRAFDRGRAEAAERFSQQARTLWSQAQAASCAALPNLQHTGLTRFCPVTPAALSRGLVRAPLRAVRRPEPSTSTNRYCDLTTRVSARAQEPCPYGSGNQTVLASVTVMAGRHSVSSRPGRPHNGTPMWLHVCMTPIAYADASD